MATSSSSTLPSGCGVFTTVPDVFFIPEFVFGGLVWILVASTKVYMDNPQGWVMFVSVFCFVFTTLWFFLFISGVNQKSSVWPTLDVAYHAIAAFFYLSASVALANVTIRLQNDSLNFKSYQEDIAAVVFSYVATLLYFIHTILSAIRWKSF
ncbi:mal, T cell differentiation protein b isoform X2 [Megalops cyprinoides]|uniref:mal, T cell differentiation protein b isoform X2 n=1 Tax=Megalops cyprinoides TaxID=118141 RepID=UPI001864182E|nr:mal, T cell differentiation protein b isoform X2 [Megalops cyprinoides]